MLGGYRWIRVPSWRVWSAGSRSQTDRRLIRPGRRIPPSSSTPPDVVQASVPFEAGVRTIGNSGCWEVARTDVENGPALAEVTPVDRDRMSEGLACTGAMVELVHELELTFTEVGEAVIRVRGREVIGDDFHSGEHVTVEKVLVVE